MPYKGMTVRQRSGGRWYARYKLDNGTYKYIYGKTQRECYDKLREFANSQSNAPKAKKKGVKLVTFGEFFDPWMKQEKEPNCREGTLRNFRSCHKHLKALDPKPLKKITADNIRQLLLASPPPEVRDKCYKMLAMIFRAAVQYDLVTANIMDKVSRFKTPKAHPQRASPTAKAAYAAELYASRERFGV